jgi:antitoxin YefM
MPRAVTYSRLRAELRSVLDEVCDNHDVVYVARHKGGDVVILSREGYESLEETAGSARVPTSAPTPTLPRQGRERGQDRLR